ncbi:MAG: agmatine deiminase family protein, partial [Phycisphaerae bacterium]|nr:agmatine deiminase family protein [Phycisphaerae bacterium]
MKRFSATAKVRTTVGLLALYALLIFASAAQVYAATMPPDVLAAIEANYPNGLPRYITPEEQQWLDEQAAIEALKAPTMEPLAEGEIEPLYVTPPGATAPPSGATWTPGEYENLAGVLITWKQYTPLLTAFAAEVSQSDTNAKVWILVEGTEQSSATSALQGAGANMSNVEFISINTDYCWIRDYGPRYFYENNGHAIMDHTYNRPRPADNAVPANLASYWSDPYYDIGLTHGGGNFHAFSDGNAFCSTLILEENSSYSENDIKEIFRDYFNVNLTIFPRLSLSVDGTGHIDMWFLPLGPKKVLISQFSTNTYGEQTTTNNAAAAMQGMGYTVYRVPAWYSSGTHYTYTNAAIVNNKVFIPRYSDSRDATALSTFGSAMPGYEIIQVDCREIIPAAGAIHCVIKHVYTPTTPVPTIEVVSPNGDESLPAGIQQQINWVASDDVSVTSVDLYYSTNNGSSWNTIATGLTNTGSYNWTIPSVDSTVCLIRAVAHDGAANTRKDASDAVFTIYTTVNYTISGTITSGGSPLSGVTMNGLPGNPTTDGSGFYSAEVTSGWSGTVTPAKSGYTFTPTNRTYSNVTANQTSQNYTATYIPPPSITDVEIIGNWATGLTHAKETGTDRVLVFITEWEDNVAPSVSVTYGGQPMTKVIDIVTGTSSYRNYVAAFILNEAGIVAATNSNFVATWSDTPSSVSYASIFLQNVDQTNIIGATDSATVSTGTTVATDPLATSDGDMVILGAVSGNNGSYELNNSFIEGTDQSVGSNGHTGVTGHKAATGANETPSATHTTSYRQAIIGFVVQAASAPPPGKATNPSPGSGTVNVSLTPTLSWTAGTGATSHIVYFGTDSTPDSSEL